MSDMPDLSDRDGLSQLLDGLSDEEITKAAEEIGVDNIITQVTEEIPKRFDASKAVGQSAVIQWDVNTSEGTKSFHLTVADGTCTSAIGPAEAPRVTLGFALPDFLNFIAGKLDGMQAFMGGKLKLTGDMMFAQQMQTWFPTA